LHQGELGSLGTIVEIMAGCIDEKARFFSFLLTVSVVRSHLVTLFTDPLRYQTRISARPSEYASS
jgi:hypothetical protein